MLSAQAKWLFICNPAAQLHSQWQTFLPQWGVPEKLAAPLWQGRHKQGTLSRFLVDKFKFSTNALLNLDEPAWQLLLSEEKKFENKLVQVGSLFFYPEVVKTISGERIRKMKTDLGEENFLFLRTRLQKFITPPLAAFIRPLEMRQISWQKTLLLGVALLLQHLPQTPDLRTFLCLKLPPWSASPQLPEGFGLLQNKIARALSDNASPFVAKTFALEGIWRQL